MKDNIKTAEQVLKDWYNPLHGISEIALLQITEAMKQYPEQFIDLAASKAIEMRYTIVEDDLKKPLDILNFKHATFRSCYAVAKQNILDTKKLIK